MALIICLYWLYWLYSTKLTGLYLFTNVKLQNTNQIIPYGPNSRLYSVFSTLVFIHFAFHQTSWFLSWKLFTLQHQILLICRLPIPWFDGSRCIYMKSLNNLRFKATNVQFFGTLWILDFATYFAKNVKSVSSKIVFHSIIL